MPYYKGEYYRDEEEYRELVIRDRRMMAEWCVEDMLRIGGLLPPVQAKPASTEIVIAKEKPSFSCDACHTRFVPGNPVRIDVDEDEDGRSVNHWIYRCPHCHQETEI